MTTAQYWSDKSGETYAVRVNDAGNVVEACGPLHHTEANKTNLEEWNFEGDDELRDDMNERPDDWTLVATPDREQEVIFVTSPVTQETYISVSWDTRGWFSCLAGTSLEGNGFEGEDMGPFPTKGEAIQAARDAIKMYEEQEEGEEN